MGEQNGPRQEMGYTFLGVYGETLVDSVYPRMGGLGDLIVIRWLPTNGRNDGSDGVPARTDDLAPEDDGSAALMIPTGV